ncbi:MAG: ankyrin repeat domain-containing protein [Planctomycetes bacterium]|nr:ankyrin repeat domain-containing protein [Planctomycetota bacterium]
MSEIHWAARRGDLLTVDAELASGASMADWDSDSLGGKWTALTHGAESRDCDDVAFEGLVERAVAEGVFPRAADAGGALQKAAKRGAKVKVRTLLAAGTGLDDRTDPRGHVLDSIAYHRHANVLWCLSAIVDSLAPGSVAPKRMAVFVRQAAGCGNRDAVRAFVRHGGEPLRRQLAKEMGELVAGLALGDGMQALECGVLGDLQDALRMAASMDELEVVEELVARGADVSALHDLHGTGVSESQEAAVARIESFLAECDARRNEIASLLDAQGAVDAARSGARASRGDSLLSYAAEGDAVRVVEWLLARGADPDHVGHNGWTPLYMAASLGSVRVTRLLLEAGAELVTEEGPIITDATADTIPLLLDAGADIDVIDECGYCPLVLAVEQGESDLVEYLLDRGAAVDNRDSSDKTALQRAVQCEEVSIVKLLLERGADPNIMDLDGYRALDYARSKYMQELIRNAGGAEGPRQW